MISVALITAIAAQAQPTAGPGMIGLLFPYAVIFLLFYFIFLRPQQKQRRAHEDRIRQIKRGEEVVTAGGIVGEVVHIKEETKDGVPAPSLDDRITIKSGESRLIVERGRISRVITRETTEVEKPK